MPTPAVDAGRPDAGIAFDAGRPDSGASLDAGEEVDAGVTPDDAGVFDGGVCAASPPFLAAGAIPTSRHESVAFYDGEHVFLMGGAIDPTFYDDILRYSPGTGTLVATPSHLPSGRNAATVAWTAGSAYVIGGRSPGFLDEIVRFTPASGAVRVMNAHLPTGRYNAAAVAVDSIIYVFGGYDGSTLAQILRYDTVADQLTVLSATLPTGREAASAVYDGSQVWVFAGVTDTSALNTIVQLDPTTEAVTDTSLVFPSGLFDSAALWDGQHVYLLGGLVNRSDIVDTVYRFTPSLGVLETLPQRLPCPRTGRGATWGSAAGYLFGGVEGIAPSNGLSYQYPADILSYSP